MTTFNRLGGTPYNPFAPSTSLPLETPASSSALDQMFERLFPQRHWSYDLPLCNQMTVDLPLGSEATVKNSENNATNATNETSTLESTELKKTSEGQTVPRKEITITLHCEDNALEGVATVSVDHPHRKNKKKGSYRSKEVQ